MVRLCLNSRARERPQIQTMQIKSYCLLLNAFLIFIFLLCSFSLSLSHQNPPPKNVNGLYLFKIPAISFSFFFFMKTHFIYNNFAWKISFKVINNVITLLISFFEPQKITKPKMKQGIYIHIINSIAIWIFFFFLLIVYDINNLLNIINFLMSPILFLHSFSLSSGMCVFVCVCDCEKGSRNYCW